MTLYCLPCCAERKMAEQQGEKLPELWFDSVREAVTLVPTPAGQQPVCWEHLIVQQQSPLLLGQQNGVLR